MRDVGEEAGVYPSKAAPEIAHLAAMETYPTLYDCVDAVYGKSSGSGSSSYMCGKNNLDTGSGITISAGVGGT